MDGVSLSSNTRAALNAGEGLQGAAISALKIAAQSEQAIVNMVAETAEMAKAAAPQGQGKYVDKLA